MGKNYTLYIKYPEFQDEENKSGLVNDLLKDHWEAVGKKVSEFRDVHIRTKQKTTYTDNKITTTVTPDSGDVKAFKKRQAEYSVGLCPNGHAIPEGRNKCMGKGCKYAV